MQVICPRCQSSSVSPINKDSGTSLVDELVSPTALVGIGISLCKAFKLPPVVGVVTGVVITATVHYVQQNHSLPKLVNQQYGCHHCHHVFNSFS